MKWWKKVWRDLESSSTMSFAHIDTETAAMEKATDYNFSFLSIMVNVKVYEGFMFTKNNAWMAAY